MTKSFRLRRIGAVDLSFDGTLLGEATTRQRGDSRWLDLRIYRTSTGRYVIEEAGATTDDPRPRAAVTVVDGPTGVRRALTKQGEPRDPARAGETVEYLTNVALDALDEAADRDPAIAEVIVDTI